MMNISTKTRADDEFFTIVWGTEDEIKLQGSQHDMYGQFPGCAHQRVEENKRGKRIFERMMMTADGSSELQAAGPVRGVRRREGVCRTQLGVRILR
jgi:hypothetical protein